MTGRVRGMDPGRIERRSTTRPRRSATPSRRRLALLAVGALVAVTACQGPAPKPSPREWIKEQTGLIRKLSSARDDERMEAVNLFLKLGPEQGSEVVLWLLDDPAIIDNPRARVNLAAILAHWKDPRGIPYLLEGLVVSQDRGILRVVEEGLQVYGENEVIVEQLGNEYILENPEELTRRVVFSVLSRLRDPAVQKLLAHGLLDEDPEVRAMSVLGIAGFPESRGRTIYLVDALTDPDPEIRRLAWNAIEEGEVPRGVRFEPEGEALERAEAVARLRRWIGVPDRTLR